jgi:hypothetical protein
MLRMSRARLIVVPLLLSACHTWSTVPLSPNTPGPLPRHSTVVLMGGERVQVEDGRTTRDSLIGDRLNGARFSVHRDSVNFVETRKVSVARSIGAGAGGLVVASAVLTVVGMVALLSELE